MSGERQRVNFIATINPDCTDAGERTQVPTLPQHGTVDLVRTREFAFYPPLNPRSQCNNRRVDGTAVFYTSEAGFRGIDRFTTATLSADGQRHTINILVDVR